MQSTLMRRVVRCLATVLFCGTAAANALSDTYYAAYTDPDSFESSHLRKVVNQDFYQNFYVCSISAIVTLNSLIKDLQAKYKACTNNAECQQVARDVQNGIYFRDKVQALDEYIKATHSQDWPPFLQSRAGKWAKEMQRSPVPVAKLPLVRGEIAQLESIPTPCR